MARKEGSRNQTRFLGDGIINMGVHVVNVNYMGFFFFHFFQTYFYYFVFFKYIAWVKAYCMGTNNSFLFLFFP